MAKKNDLTRQAVTQQLNAMDCPTFDIGVLDGTSGKMMNREWSRDQVLANVGWLKHMNVRGNHIYVRPKANTWHRLVLADDLTRDTIERMRRDGVDPALVVETSPENFQAWVSVAQVSRKILPPEIRGAIAKHFVQQYGSDKRSADPDHYGRLAGFTNRKPEHRTPDGRYPWVLLREHGGQAASAAADLVAAAEAALQKEAQQTPPVRPVRPKSRASRAAVDRTGSSSSEPLPLLDGAAVDRYAQLAGQWIKLVREKDWDEDMSRVDWRVCLAMLKEGWEPSAVYEGLQQSSPQIEIRKVGHIENYGARTVVRALVREKGWDANLTRGRVDWRPFVAMLEEGCSADQIREGLLRVGAPSAAGEDTDDLGNFFRPGPATPDPEPR